MNKEIKAKWLEALRSGKYSQITRGLRTLKNDGTRGYCCLGVLCDIVDPTGWDQCTYHYKGKNSDYNECSSANLPHELATNLELIRSNVEIIGCVDVKTSFNAELADLNDSGFTFDQIADIIEYFL